MFVLIFIGRAVNLQSQEFTKRAIILGQSDDYQESVSLAEKSAKALNLSLNLRDLEPYKAKYLSFDRKTCEKSEKQFPCYKARSIDGTLGYISIEETRYYSNLPNKIFSIIALISKDNGSAYKIVLSEIRKTYPKAMDLMIEVDEEWKENY